MEDIKSKRSEAANARWSKEKAKSEEPADMQMHSGNNADAMQNYAKERKGKEKKVNEINNKKTTRQRTAYAEDSSPYRLAVYLHGKIMAHAKESGVGHHLEKADMQKWADTCRKLMEIDKVDKTLIRDVIDWATSHDFWKTNILSADKLRAKFPDLAIKMRQERGKGQMAPAQLSQLPEAFRATQQAPPPTEPAEPDEELQALLAMTKTGGGKPSG